MSLNYDLGVLKGSLDAAARIADHAEALLAEARTLITADRCTAVGWPTQAQAVMCELPAHDTTTYHRAHFMGTGIVEWRDTAHIHPREVTTGAVDPDDQHDIAKESQEDPL